MARKARRQCARPAHGAVERQYGVLLHPNRHRRRAGTVRRRQLPARDAHSPLAELDRQRYEKSPSSRWIWRANPNACLACQALDGRKFLYPDVPARPHPTVLARSCRHCCARISTAVRVATRPSCLVLTTNISNNIRRSDRPTPPAAGRRGAPAPGWPGQGY